MILEQLYYGNLSPIEDAVANDAQFKALSRQVGERMEELSTKLSQEQMWLVDQAMAAVSEMHCLEERRQFEYRFSLGLLMMKEVSEGRLASLSGRT